MYLKGNRDGGVESMEESGKVCVGNEMKSCGKEGMVRRDGGEVRR